MMRVTVIPIIPIKEAVFTSRLICYKEAFSATMPTEKTSWTTRKPLPRKHECRRALG